MSGKHEGAHSRAYPCGVRIPERGQSRRGRHRHRRVGLASRR